MQSADDGSLPGPVLLTDQYLDRRQVIGELCRGNVSTVVCVAVHLHVAQFACQHITLA